MVVDRAAEKKAVARQARMPRSNQIQRLDDRGLKEREARERGNARRRIPKYAR
jgi:hypothetical protein